MLQWSLFASVTAMAMRGPAMAGVRTVSRPFVASRILACDTPAAADPARRKGSVKWFNTQKGFGFITPEDGGSDIFVHQTAIYAPGFRSLADGEPVEFDVEHGPDGRVRAMSVTGPDGEYVQGVPREPIYKDDE